MEDFHKHSYEKHREEFNDFSEDAVRRHKAWFDETTIDYWRHFRMIEPLSGLMKANPGASWLTVGDGRFGLDAIKLKKIEPSISVLPTDISPYLLERSKAEGHIEDFRVENAEALSFDDNQFDFVFCKEAYHHFPRPYIAVYEMMRVARKAVIFVEPNDHTATSSLQRISNRVKSIVKSLIGRTSYHPDHWKFEPSGNYIYTISPREMEKIALGLHLKYIAYCFFNDYYEDGVEFERAEESSALFRKVRNRIRRADHKADLGLSVDSGIISIIFLKPPSPEELQGLADNGFRIVELPDNPYSDHQ